MKRGRPRKKKPLSETENIEEGLAEEELTDKWKDEEEDEEDDEELLEEQPYGLEERKEFHEANLKEKPILTKHGLELLKKELKELKTIKRQEVAERIRQAREFGDLSENSEYEEAKKDQMFVENRIAELEDILKSAIIIEETPEESNDLAVQVGTTVKLQSINDSSIKEYKIVGTLEADPFNNIVSNSSPLGRALIGRKKGNIVRIETNGRVLKYKILDIKRTEND